ncbi:hypothetical protein PENTCL1PPCAC_4984, partial [Pristionchus entomophagus]
NDIDTAGTNSLDLASPLASQKNENVVGTASLLNSAQRNKRETIRTLDCPQCTKTEMTMASFIKHLSDNHKTTPARARLSFKCACGFISNNYTHARIHHNSCTSSAISIVKRASTPPPPFSIPNSIANTVMKQRAVATIDGVSTPFKFGHAANSPSTAPSTAGPSSSSNSSPDRDEPQQNPLTDSPAHNIIHDLMNGPPSA